MQAKQKHHSYTLEQDEWLRQNFATLHIQELSDRFNKLFGVDLNKRYLQAHCNNQLNLRKHNQHKFTEDELTFIEHNYKIMSNQELADNIGVSINSIKNCKKRNGWKSVEPHDKWTEDMDVWLIQNYLECNNYTELAVRFSTIFGKEYSQYALRSRATRYLKLISNRQGNAPAGWNSKEIGSETVLSHSGYTYIKVADRKWIPKQQYIWEQAYGKIQDGEMVVFLDGDKTNFSLDNLTVVTRKISAMMSSSDWYSTDSTFNKTAIDWCKLYFGLKETADDR